MKIDSFVGQREDEEIVIAWRQHPLVMARSALIIAGLIILGSLPQIIWSPSWGLKFLLLFIIAAAIYGLLSFYMWFNTIYILTNQRILGVEQPGVLSRMNNEVPLQNIQNAFHQKKGVLQTMFDFGTIEIQTSGAKTALLAKNTEHPFQVQQKILAKYEH